jgi:pimeloyl-ACP methyl ester carboxylesterase
MPPTEPAPGAPRALARTRGRRRALAALPVALTLSLVAACAGPPRPAPPGLGSLGPCTETVETIANPQQFGQTLNIFSPGGSAVAPTGGTCNDDNRPTAIVVHGLSASFTWVYSGIISHLVAQGNVVIFATYATDTSDFVGSFQREDEAIVLAAAATDRVDLERVGIIGHSMGGGAIPYLVQRLDARGWGSNGLWVMSLAPWVVAGVPATGPIVFPSHAHVVVQAYSDDTLVARSTGVDMFNRLSTPLSRKQHVTLRTTSNAGVTLNATHTTPNSVIAPEDAMKFYGIYRIADALQGCSQRGQHCSTDFSFMGQWADGTPVLPAVSTDTPAP